MVEELSRELPGLRTYVTLSPAPGFGGWLGRVQAEPAAVGLAGLDLGPLRELVESGWHETLPEPTACAHCS